MRKRPGVRAVRELEWFIADQITFCGVMGQIDAANVLISIQTRGRLLGLFDGPVSTNARIAFQARETEGAK